MPKASPIAIEAEVNTSKLDLRSLLLTKPIRKKIKKYFKSWLTYFFTQQAPKDNNCKENYNKIFRTFTPQLNCFVILVRRYISCTL